MKLSTKTVASLLVVTAVAAAVPGLSQIAVPKKRRESQFDRLLSTHDRKGEIRAQLLGVSAHEFRRMRRNMSFDQVLRVCGFYSKRDFRVALLGYLRGELIGRGWSRDKIESYIMVRAPRMA